MSERMNPQQPQPHTMLDPYLGVGAAAQDWNDIYNASGAGNADQSVDLPLHGSFKLSNITPLLEDDEGYDTWFNQIERAFRVHNLHQLIDASIPKPRNTAPNSRNWYHLTLHVRAWLTTCIDPQLVREVDRRGQPVNFADDFMKELKIHLKGEGHYAMKTAALELLEERLKTHDRVDEFIFEIRRELQTAQDLKTTITPWLALVLMLNELQTIPAMKHVISSQQEDLNAMEQPGNLTMTQFYGITTKLLECVKQKGIDPDY